MNITINTNQNHIIVSKAANKTYASDKASFVKALPTEFQRGIKSKLVDGNHFYFCTVDNKAVVVIADKNHVNGTLITRPGNAYEIKEISFKASRANTKSVIDRIEADDSEVAALKAIIASLESKLVQSESSNAKFKKIINEAREQNTDACVEKILAKSDYVKADTEIVITYNAVSEEAIETIREFNNITTNVIELAYKAQCAVECRADSEVATDNKNKMFAVAEVINMAVEIESNPTEIDNHKEQIKSSLNDITADMNSTSAAIDLYNKIDSEHKAYQAAIDADYKARAMIRIKNGTFRYSKPF